MIFFINEKATKYCKSEENYLNKLICVIKLILLNCLTKSHEQTILQLVFQIYLELGMNENAKKLITRHELIDFILSVQNNSDALVGCVEILLKFGVDVNNFSLYSKKSRFVIILKICK